MDLKFGFDKYKQHYHYLQGFIKRGINIFYIFCVEKS